jgi:type II secretory pathway pseudopilin PulG
MTTKTTITRTKFQILDFEFWIKILNPKSEIQDPKPGESGAALIALLALMAIVAIAFLAAAPVIQQQIVREREKEAIARGDEIAEAIRLYAIYNGGQLPKNMDDLLKGVKIPGRTKPFMILRESAAKDPLTGRDWKLLQSNDKRLADFVRKVKDFNNGMTPSNPEPHQVFDQAAAIAISTIPDAELSEDNDAPGGEDTSSNIDAPFVGVTSRAQTRSVITFYGIERHDRWIFTPLFRGPNNNLQIIPGNKVFASPTPVR